jgi:uncharacterized protein YbbK (DUF523 family)
MEKILVSACLLGLKTRYDGTDAMDERLKVLAGKCVLIPVCPEILGGLTVPREAATIEQGDGADFWERGGRIVLKDGNDVSGSFKAGAERAAALAKFMGISRIILKEGSPSCGVGETNTSFNRTKGMGVTAFLLKDLGYRIDTVDSFIS